MILGDNLFYGDIHFFRSALSSQITKKNGVAGIVFAYSVADPSAYGVVEFDKKTMMVKSIEEKPAVPKSSYAIPGLYIFDKTSVAKAKALKASRRGETEIVDLIHAYKNENSLGVEIITRGVAWLDTGTPRSLLGASSYIGAIEERQGLVVACLEEVAYRMGFITVEELEKNIRKLPESTYREYLKRFLIEIIG